MCKLLSAMAMAGTIVVPPESRDEVHRLVEVKLQSNLDNVTLVNRTP